MIWQAIDGVVCCFGVPILPFIHAAEQIYGRGVTEENVIPVKEEVGFLASEYEKINEHQRMARRTFCEHLLA